MLREFLRTSGLAWETLGADAPVIRLHKLLAERGVLFAGKARVVDHKEAEEYRRRRRPRVKECYYNAQMFAVESMWHGWGYVYHEGYAFNGLLPFCHGWVVAPDGRVVDHTLEAADRITKRAGGGQDTEYVGLPVPATFLAERMSRTGMAEPVLWEYYCRDVLEGLDNQPTEGVRSDSAKRPRRRRRRPAS